MLKLIGALCILGASACIGLYQALQLAKRPQQIREIAQSLQRLETEIDYGLTPLSDALLTCSQPLSEPIAAIYRRIAEQLEHDVGKTTVEIWRQEMAAGWSNTAMKKSELNIMLQLGHSLGISDRMDQMKHLKLAAGHLQLEESNAAEERKRYETMWKSLGVLSGALLVILMY